MEWDDDETLIDAVTGLETRYGDLDPDSREELSWLEEPAELDGDLTVTQAVVSPGTRCPGPCCRVWGGSTRPPWPTC